MVAGPSGQTAGPVLAATGILLRPPRAEELDYIRKLWADPLTMAEVGGPIRVDPEQARGWYARMVSPGEETDRYFLIFNEEGRPVGEISFHRYDKDAGCAEFNIKIEAGQRGRGYAGKAVPLLLRYFFCEFGGKTMLDPVARDNRPGQEALTRLGFKRDHSRQDVCLLFMTKGEFISIYGR